MGGLNVHEMLQRRKPYHALSPRWCVLCRKDGEYADHLFLHCQFSLNLWSKVLEEFSLQWVVPKHCTDLIELGYGFPFCKKSRSLWNVVVMATCWSIWLERSKRIFEDSIDNVDCLWDKIKYWVAIWLFDVKGFKDALFSDFVRGWSCLL